MILLVRPGVRCSGVSVLGNNSVRGLLVILGILSSFFLARVTTHSEANTRNNLLVVFCGIVLGKEHKEGERNQKTIEYHLR